LKKRRQKAKKQPPKGGTLHSLNVSETIDALNKKRQEKNTTFLQAEHGSDTRPIKISSMGRSGPNGKLRIAGEKKKKIVGPQGPT
jgi:hypothetical protein